VAGSHGNSLGIGQTMSKAAVIPSAAPIFEKYGLGGMAFYFALYAVMVGVILAAFCGLSTVLLGVPDILAVVIFVAIWFGIIVWLWLGMVRAGKLNKEEKAHDYELLGFKLSFLIILVILVGFAFQIPLRHGEAAVAFVVLDWIFLGLQSIYLLLSLCVGVGMPMRNCVVFLVLLGLAVILTLRL
jgi:hypothetical protein